MRREHAYVVSLGSNIDPTHWVPCAVTWLRGRFEVEAVSAAYASPAVGPGRQPDFVNGAVRLRTDLPPRALRAVCRHLEALCGRVRGEDRFAPRTLDVDLVYAGGRPEVLDPDLLAQAHVLVPCAEAWPAATVGAGGPTLAAEAARRFPDWGDAHRMPGGGLEEESRS